MTYEEEIEIDTKRNRFRNHVTILGVSIAKWQSLSEVKYISVVRYLGSVRVSQYRIKHNYHHKYKLNLVVDDQQRIIKVKTLGKEEALSETINIGRVLNLRVLNCTTHERKWIR